MDWKSWIKAAGVRDAKGIPPVRTVVMKKQD